MSADNPNCESCGRPKNRRFSNVSRYCINCAIEQAGAAKKRANLTYRAQRRKRPGPSPAPPVQAALLALLLAFALFVTQVMVR